MRVGSSLSEPHSCKNCGKSVDESGLHGLSCWRSQGRRARHSELNQIIHRSLAAIQVPSTLEPRGLYRSDGRRPDGLSLIPWSQGRSLVWDATCRDTFAPSYLHTLAPSKQAQLLTRQLHKNVDCTVNFAPHTNLSPWHLKPLGYLVKIHLPSSKILHSAVVNIIMTLLVT